MIPAETFIVELTRADLDLILWLLDLQVVAAGSVEARKHALNAQRALTSQARP